MQRRGLPDGNSKLSLGPMAHTCENSDRGHPGSHVTLMSVSSRYRFKSSALLAHVVHGLLPLLWLKFKRRLHNRSIQPMVYRNSYIVLIKLIRGRFTSYVNVFLPANPRLSNFWQCESTIVP